ncbi:MAG: hypothetical protein HUN04_25165 [Desulfobacter sp.]|nr:MAG: hypothetical protein HUN04_25165 [Desulfobacter sp.]
MLGFLKKKKKTDPEPSGEAAAPEKTDGKEAASTPAPKKKKKGGGIKKWIFIVLVLAAFGGAGYFVYAKYFAAPPPGTRIYRPVPMAHVQLPEEMMAFSFQHFPDLYDAMAVYNSEMDLFEAEIKRIEAVAAKYPDQKKIAEGQKKVWVKGKNTLSKAFTKLEKPVKEAYVLYQVNQARGREQIKAKSEELADSARDALKTAQELTAVLKENAPKPPEGWVGGTIYKIKKIFQ